MSETEDKLAIFCKHCKRRIHPDDYSGSGFRHEEDWSISCSGILAEPELKLEQAMLDAELTEQRKTILDDPANTLFGIPMTAVKRLIDEKRAEEGNDWWVLESSHIKSVQLAEQRGVTSAKKWLKQFHVSDVLKAPGFNFGPVTEHDIEQIAKVAEAYASSRLAAQRKRDMDLDQRIEECRQKCPNCEYPSCDCKAQIQRERREALSAHLPPGFDIGDEATAELAVKLVASEARLAEVTAQLQAERKEYEKEIDRLQSVCVLAEKERDALAKPVDGMSDSNYETGQTLWREWFEGGDRKPPEIPADTSLMLTWIVAKFRAKLHVENATLRAELERLTTTLKGLENGN